MKIKTPYRYGEYLDLTRKLIEDHSLAQKSYDQSKHEFFHLNLRRMERINKTIQLKSEFAPVLENVSAQTWVVISEPWCGDSAQVLPCLAAIAEASNRRIELRIVLRDTGEEWINRYLTNGSKSIPKLIAFAGHADDYQQELFQWGPRPAGAVEVYKAWKAEEHPREKTEFEKDLHTWYAQDKTLSLQEELLQILQLEN